MFNDTNFARFYVFLDNYGYENVEHAVISSNYLALKNKNSKYV
jgi:hypothetical protein